MTLRLIQLGQTTPTKERAIGNVAAKFPLHSEANYWSLWSYGGDLGGERSAIQDIVSRTKSSDVVWDIGANKGHYSAFLSQVTENVCSFEPGVDARKYLAEVESLNGDFTIYETALGSTDGTGGFESGSVNADGGGDYVLRRGDTLVNNGLPAPDVVKADIEGAELDMLDGLGSVLEDVRLVYVEPHPSKGTPIDALQSRLLAEGFDIDTISTDCREPIIRGER
jgi:FkbM family methyltransferase